MRGGRPRWSQRRRRTLAGLCAGALLGALGGLLPDELGVTSLFAGALCAFLLVVATVVFVAVPGPGTLEVLLNSPSPAGACLVVAVLLLLAAPPELRALWWTGVAGAAVWTGAALWRTRDRDG